MLDFYKTGHEEIDQDHEKLFEILKIMVNKEELKEDISELKIFLIKHFANEERIMETVNYPLKKYHRDAHSELLVSYNRLIESKDRSLRAFLAKDLKTMFEHHIEWYDIPFGNHLAGLKSGRR